MGKLAVIIITGCARSGTSITARVFEACGARFGPTNVLIENRTIRDGMIKPYLRSIGADPLGQSPLPNVHCLAPFPGLRDMVVEALPDEPRAYKGAKACLMWPVWDDAFADALWVIVRRETASIVDSCLRAGFMRAHGDADGWREWVAHHLDRLEEIETHCRSINVWALPVEDAERQFRPAIEAAGLQWDADAVARAIVTRSP